VFNNYSRIEIAAKLLGSLGVFLGVVMIVYTLEVFYHILPLSKFILVSGVFFGSFLCYLGYLSLQFKQNEKPHVVYEFEIVD